MTANLAIALYTPPVGGTLFVAAKLAGAGIGEITRALWPLLLRVDRGALRHHLRAVAHARGLVAGAVSARGRALSTGGYPPSELTRSLCVG